MNSNRYLNSIKRDLLSNLFLSFFFFLFINSIHFSQTTSVNDGIKGNLVTVNWLEKNLNNKNLIVLDASMPQQYSTAHIPGAVNANFMSYGVKEVSVSEFETLFQMWGISTDKQIVIYDRGTPMMATRIFFDLYYSGFPVNNLFILDGGFSKWQETGKPVLKEPSVSPQKGSFRVSIFNENIRAKLPEVLNASGERNNNVLLEALDPNWHFGESQFFDRPGHIPFGVMIPSTDFFNKDMTFKSPEEIKKILDYFSISKQKQIYTYCGGGIAASVPFFALKFILNYPNVKLFRESEMGWVQDSRELPFWTYDAPYLMRETNWLKTWGGKTMRMYGVSQVNIIDVRSADEYNHGHIPFAINIPFDILYSNINNPEKLTQMLSTLGVQTHYESVIVSGKGVDKHSALAFLILEYLGYKKVSIFIDSIEKFVKSGVELVKEEKQGGLNSTPDYKSKPILNVDLNKVLISDPFITKGLYPKVFINSGKIDSNKFSNGKVLNVLSGDLLTLEGKPKAAKDIWKILTSAGLPRYSEIICISDDPGEAAVIYFVTKLMGYPDSKVLVNK